MKFIAKFFTILFLIKVFINIVATNPFIGLFHPACFVVKNESCPNENITFWLYTRETREMPEKLDPLHLDHTLFEVPRPLKILIHGYTGHRDYAPNIPIRAAFLDNNDYNVISMDYGPLVRYPCYFAAVDNLRVASKCLAQLINNLLAQNISRSEDIHLIGFSLGSQLAGQTANYVETPLKRITGLDPARPMFVTASWDRKLDPSDAEFVDVIHTDIFGRGMLQSLGHVDFYPNIGLNQPGCQQENVQNPGSCNHERAPRFYAESIYSDVGFWGYFCSSWFHYFIGNCRPNEKQAIMGFHVDKSSRGSYFLKTAPKSPFALGVVPFQKTAIKNSVDSLENYLDLEYSDMSSEPQPEYDYY